MTINANLADVLANITRNRQQVETNLKQAIGAASQLDDESRAAIDLLLKKYEHPQAIGQFVQAVAQAEGLKKATAEMDTAIAVLQTVMLNDDVQAQAQLWLDANKAVIANPLPPAGQGSASGPAVEASSAPPAA